MMRLSCALALTALLSLGALLIEVNAITLAACLFLGQGALLSALGLFGVWCWREARAGSGAAPQKK